jgi:assimilatory nitrate reductase catalytic subunit
VRPPDGVRSDLDLIAGLAERLDSPVPFATDPEEVFAELGRASAGGPADYSAITYDRIRAEHGVFWGGERLFADRFAHPDGRARMYAVAHRGAAEQPCADYPLHLTTGRVLAQYQSGAQTRRVRDLPDSGPFVEVHPLLAGRLGIEDGADLRVSTRRGTMTAPARVVATIRPDTVFVPFHWVGANRLTNDALDPVSRMPEFKVCAAAVAPA